MLYKKGDIVYLAGRPFRVTKDRVLKDDNLRIETPTSEDTSFLWEHIDGDYRCTNWSTMDIWPQMVHLFKSEAKNNKEALKFLRRD